MNNAADSVHGPIKPCLIPHVAEKKPRPAVIRAGLRHLPLLHLVARMDDKPDRVMLPQSHGDESGIERSGSAGD